MRNYYDILGVQKSASKDEIKKAFRKLAHQFHPDKKGGNADKFKELNEAYSVLSDDKKRAEYDTYGRVFNEAGGSSGGNAGGFNPEDFGFDFSGANGQGFEGFQNFDFGDIFGDFFGGGRREQAVRGRDISIDLELAFEESIFGVDRKVHLTKNVICDRCKGNGGEPNTEMKTCPSCNGKGKIHETRRSILGSFSTVATCNTCRGKGKIPKEKCSLCHGAGILSRQEEISIRIPSGIDDGEMIRLAGKGEAASGGTTGDLYVKIHVKRHPLFAKEGTNLTTTLGIKLTTALLGGEYILNTLDGNITVKIPEGVTHGEILRVKGKGVPVDKNRRGDLMIRLQIQLPKKLSRQEKHLIEELKKEGL